MSRVTVAICTWNRAVMLDRALAHLQTLRIPPGVSWELLVVNNNSSDDTDAVVDRYLGRLPVRRVFEPEAGISHARNRALREATGDVIAWTDDDAFPDPNWLIQLCETFDRADADLVFGKVLPAWETGTPPAWYTPRFGGMFALIDLGDETRVYTDPRVVGFNVNLAFRVTAVKPLGGYRNEIGTGRMAGGEDTDLFVRAYAAGLKVVYQPQAVVRHWIPASRATKAFYRRYTWGGSPNHLRLLRDEAQVVPRFLGLPRYFVRQQFGHLSMWVRSLLKADGPNAFYFELKLIRLFGLYWAMLARTDPRDIAHRAGE